MSLLLDAPAVTASAPGPRRRRSLLPLVAVLCVIAGVAVSLSLMAPRAASFAPVAPTAVGAPFVTVPEFGPRGSRILGYQHGATTRLSLPLHNSGRLPVTVTAVHLGGGPAPLLSVQGQQGLPLTLLPGRSGSVTLTLAMVNCRFFNERELQIYDAVRVEFRSLGRAGERLVPYDFPILVKSPMIVGCPDRKLDRSENRRHSLL